MSFYIDIRLPVGIRVEAQVRDKFSGTLKSLLAEILKDLEENTTKHYLYFLRERLSQKERKVFRILLQEIQEEHQSKFGFSLEQLEEVPKLDISPILRRYQCQLE